MKYPEVLRMHGFGARASLLSSGAFLAFSCLLSAADTTTAANKPVTFTKDIAPIFQEKCEACHRKDSMAPMSLVTYQEVRPWAKSIKERVVVSARCRRGISIRRSAFRNFQNDRSLNDEQIATIVRWVDAGAPMGDPKDMPPPKQFPDENTWQLAKTYGEPDLIIKSRYLHDAGGGSGSMVAADDGNPVDRAALGARGRNAAGDSGRPQDYASRDRLSVADGTEDGERSWLRTIRSARSPAAAF